MIESSNTHYSADLKIISVGNDLYGDDGVGIEILNRLKNESAFEKSALADCATDALNIIDHFSGAKYVVIIDAAKMSSPPGTVNLFNAEDAHIRIQSDHLSVHGISIADAINIAKQIGAYPESVMILGIEPEQISVDAGLSKTVLNAIPNAISKLIDFQNTLNLN